MVFNNKVFFLLLSMLSIAPLYGAGDMVLVKVDKFSVGQQQTWWPWAVFVTGVTVGALAKPVFNVVRAWRERPARGRKPVPGARRVERDWKQVGPDVRIGYDIAILRVHAALTEAAREGNTVLSVFNFEDRILKEEDKYKNMSVESVHSALASMRVPGDFVQFQKEWAALRYTGASKA